jgi:anti-anti-sigma factor
VLHSRELEIEVTVTGKLARVKLRGRLDTPGVDRIEAKFTSAVVPDGKNTVVDLSEVSFIASMGLRMFIGIAKSLKRNNARMVLFAPQSQVNEIFNTVVLRDIVPIVVDEAEAVRFAVV